jgi:hypothetical protein
MRNAAGMGTGLVMIPGMTPDYASPRQTGVKRQGAGGNNESRKPLELLDIDIPK